MNILVNKVYEEYSDQLTKKGAKKNKRTKEELINSIATEYDSLDINSMTEEDILDKLRRAAFTYMNEPLMFKLVRKFSNLSLPEEDRISAARVGFSIAMNKFDPSLGYQFSTFAWRVISNEIIHANKLYNKPSLYYDDDRDIFATSNGKIIRIVKSKNARKVTYKGEEVIPYDIVAIESGSEKIYPYVYNINVSVGDEIYPGLKLGRTAGAIIDIGSTNEIVDSEDIGDVVFRNILDGDDNDDIESRIIKEDLKEILAKGIESLGDLERKIIIDRFISEPKVPRHELSSELGMSEYIISKKEREALDKLEECLKNNNISRKDLKI